MPDLSRVPLIRRAIRRRCRRYPPFLHLGSSRRKNRGSRAAADPFRKPSFASLSYSRALLLFSALFLTPLRSLASLIFCHFLSFSSFLIISDHFSSFLMGRLLSFASLSTLLLLCDCPSLDAQYAYCWVVLGRVGSFWVISALSGCSCTCTCFHLLL
jgi:hypothetical protein